MTVPQLQISSTSPHALAADVLAFAVSHSDAGPVLLADPGVAASLLPGGGSAAVLAALGVTGAEDEVLRLQSNGFAAKSIALVGVGKGEVSPDSLRYAAGSATRQLRGVQSIAFDFPAADDDALLAVLEGAAIGAYVYADYRVMSKDPSRSPATTITLISDRTDTAAIVHRATVTAEAIHQVRDLVTMPASDLYPATFADAVRELASNVPVDVTVFGHDELVAGGFGGILGVGQGSVRGPRLVKISYSPPTARRHLALVGKGITFDTGGLSLKQPAGMVGMKYDMTGAATVMAVTLAAASLGVDTRITAWLCIAENMPSGSATRPGDVLRIHGGRTVEVLNTDAEGRLVMADGLAAASEEYPDAIVDVATLTGAARVALGNRYAGLMGDTGLVASIADAARRTGELVWPMPLPGELRASINSDIADIANAKIGSTAGGMLLAGLFLQEFVGPRRDDKNSRIPWAHLDIAGPANNAAGGYGFTGKGATGVTVRALLRLAEDISLA
jgi:leucyl aminopeptidase